MIELYACYITQQLLNDIYFSCHELTFLCSRMIDYESHTGSKILQLVLCAAFCVYMMKECNLN